MITPDRVLINRYGTSLPPSKAKSPVDIVFIRDDNWSLGTRAEWEGVAYAIWKDLWVAFQRRGEAKKPISQYQPKET